MRMMFSVTSPRETITRWLERRGFMLAGSMPYPAGIGHILTLNDVKLNVYLRPITRLDSSLSLDADSKNPPEPSILKLNNILEDTKAPADASAVGSRCGLPLPPHWRPEMYTKTTTIVQDGTNDLKPKIDIPNID